MVFDAIHAFDLNEFRQQIRKVVDRIAIVKIGLAHPTFRKPLKECSNRVIGGDFRPCFFNHAPVPLVT